MDIESFDLRAYLHYLSIPFWEHGSSSNVSRNWLGIQCIYCRDNSNHLGINLTYKSFSCWKCGSTGSLISLIQEIEDINYGAALYRINDFQTLIPEEGEKPERLKDLGQGILPGQCLEELTQGQRGYLQSRRFDPDSLVEEWGIIAGPISGPWRYRIIIPLTLGGRVVTWIGMATTGVQSIKYKAATVQESFIPAGELLYGMDYVGRNVLVVEGVTDAWRMGKGAVALLGMGQSVNKLEPLISLAAEHYYIMMDGTTQAIENAHLLGHSLASVGKKVEVLELDSGDPDDLSDSEAREWRKELGL